MKQPTVQWFWEPRDVWVGIYWTRGGDRSLRVYICLLPMLPILLRFPPLESYDGVDRRRGAGQGRGE